MATVYVEPRPKGRAAIENYVVETEGDRLLHTAKTQQAAIEWARKERHTIHVARVRHLTDKRIPDHWRKI